MDNSSSSLASTAVLILAGGQGKRMRSALPKVLHSILFQPMVHHLIDTAKQLNPKKIIVVVGHGAEAVRESCKAYPELEFVVQKEQLGTGHAVMAAQSVAQNYQSLLILSGDVVLLRKQTLENLIKSHQKGGSSGVLLSAHVENPHGYGRILRDSAQKAKGICEEVDCTPEQKTVREVNAGVYVFATKPLFEALSKVDSRNKQGEYYLTDVVSLLARKDSPMAVMTLEDPQEMWGINDKVALSEAEKILQRRVNKEWMLAGATLHDPDSIWIDKKSVLEQDSVIGPGCTLIRSHIGPRVLLESFCRIENTHLHEGAVIKQGSYLSQSEVGQNSTVGPYAHLRPGSKLKASVKVGNFVEIKKSTLETNVKVSHLSYVGDANVGENSNMGCGFITCNFDGSKKHQTEIGKNVFVGSDTQCVAPVTIGDDCYIAAGSTITEDVEPGSLAISRTKQIVKKGYAKKYPR